MKEPYLGNPAATADVLRRHGISARKRYGQNFLTDAKVLEKIIKAAEVGPDDTVLEIGPGIGTLTQYLAGSAGSVAAVEIDRNLLPVLAETLDGFDNVEVINADILKTDIAGIAARKNGGRPLKVVANLPYYITTPIIMTLLESGAPIASITVMVQKEVADRMTAVPGSAGYGALSLAVQYYCETRIAAEVDPGSFIPRPEVMSAVVHMKKRAEPPVHVRDEDLMFQLIRASFNQRRKKLTNGIANFPGLGYTKEDVAKALHMLGIREDVRGENLSLAQFAALSDALA